MTKKDKKQNEVKKARGSGTALKVAGGVLAGAAVASAAAVLFAPDSGKNTRKKIAAKTKKVAGEVKAKVKKVVEAGKKKFTSPKAEAVKGKSNT